MSDDKKVNWALPKEHILVMDTFGVMAIVHFDVVKKYYENLGYIFKGHENYDGEIMYDDICGFWYDPDIINDAVIITESLYYGYNKLLIPNKVGIALLPFGNRNINYAFAIAPKIVGESE